MSDTFIAWIARPVLRVTLFIWSLHIQEKRKCIKRVAIKRDTGVTVPDFMHYFSDASRHLSLTKVAPGLNFPSDFDKS